MNPVNLQHTTDKPQKDKLPLVFPDRLSPSLEGCNLPYIWLVDTMGLCCGGALGGVAESVSREGK